MREMKKVLILVVLLIAAVIVSAESYINIDFSAYGIESIGVYTEGYEDERVEDFEAAYLDAYMMQSVNTFRYTLCDYNGVTPKLMTPGYPLQGTDEATDLDDLISLAISNYGQNENWKISLIDDFQAGNLADLRAKAVADGLDAVLVTRYYYVEHYVPFSGYSSVTGYSTISTSARVGELQKGLALIPSIELYDAESGIRLWYSANWTGNITGISNEEHETHLRNFEEFFVTQETVESGNTLETQAATIMVTTAMAAAGFPSASESGNRDESLVAANSGNTHLFWTDYPGYDMFGTLLGLGYNFSYIGDFPLYYEVYKGVADGEEEQLVAGTASNAMLHNLTVPIFAFGTKNFSFEPSFYFGFMHTTGSAAVSQEQWGQEDIWDMDSDWILTDTYAGIATAWGMTVGLDFALKYYLRFTDRVAAFVGGRGLIEMWVVNVNDDSEDNLYFSQKVGGLIDLDPFMVNASLLVGMRFDTSTPFEVFGMFTPVGPGSESMISLGFNWHGATFEWTEPHAKNSEVFMHWD